MKTLKVLELFDGVGAPRKALKNLFGSSKIKNINYVEIKKLSSRVNEITNLLELSKQDLNVSEEELSKLSKEKTELLAKVELLEKEIVELEETSNE